MKGFFILLYYNVKRMATKHTLVFCILIIGLIVSGFSMGIYYRISSQLILSNSMVSGSYSSVEIHEGIYALDKDRLLNAVLELEKEGKSPKVYGVSAISYNSEITDIIGVYGRVSMCSTIAGKDYLAEEFAPGEIFIPLSYVDVEKGETLDQFIGTEKRIGSKIYSIGGIYDDLSYTPNFYDVRRIDESLYETTGERPDEDNIIDRDTIGVFVNFNDMDENNTISSFRVLYATGLTEGQRRNIERELYRRAIIDPEIARDMNEQDIDAEFEALHDNIFAKWETANAALTSGYYSQLLLYILAIVLSLINVITLYSSVLDMNKQQNEIFKVCGMTTGSRLLLIIIEIFIYSAVSFAIGLFLSEIFAMNTELIPIVGSVSIWTYILLVLCMIVTVMLMLSFSIKRYVKGRD